MKEVQACTQGLRPKRPQVTSRRQAEVLGCIQGHSSPSLCCWDCKPSLGPFPPQVQARQDRSWAMRWWCWRSCLLRCRWVGVHAIFFFFSWPAVDAQHPDPVCSWVSPLLPASYPCMPHWGRQALASSPRQTRSCRCRPFPAFHSLPSMHASENWCGQNPILGGRPTCAALPRPHALPCPACAAVHPGGEEPGGSACAGAWHVPLPFHPPWCTCDARRRPTAQACTLPCPVQKLCALRPFWNAHCARWPPCSRSWPWASRGHGAWRCPCARCRCCATWRPPMGSPWRTQAQRGTHSPACRRCGTR